ncbi:fumarate hydratase C-terminal domain-containing protein [Tissierella sp. MB52-C2]|uniref:fumarate hydratase C-terminal domain-containing protein n=1 Tax=Tissierella sp. MB52-C2 TaxID=3070999 RepID=UPI00280A7FC1|nr:fumarate hydratase C-terminal domain-containing protein [Tissierella sp. MB52-C2]WMM24189.1 fumarate hydratase C-terminal domain-containing protein [Tissierella sp. MB52-C2]
MKELRSPISKEDIQNLHPGDQVFLSGNIFTGRDAVLPKLVDLIKMDKLEEIKVDLDGSVIFHTAVSPAGVGPTSSNKLDIESSIPILSQAGVRLHLGKGKLKKETINALNIENSAYATLPPVTALLESKIIRREVVAFSEEGMEAMNRLFVERIPIIIVAVNGITIEDIVEKEKREE